MEPISGRHRTAVDDHRPVPTLVLLLLALGALAVVAVIVMRVAS